MKQRRTVVDVGLAAFRIAVGVYWLYEQHWKLPPDFGLHDPRGLMFAFRESATYPTIHLYGAFIQDVVIPHFHLFAWLLLLTETVIGLSILLGAWTKIGAFLGVIQAVNLLVAQASTPEGPWIYAAILAVNLLVLVTPSDRALSVDAWRTRSDGTRSS
ncbi:MAG: DoxX family protein [bacterium]